MRAWMAASKKAELYPRPTSAFYARPSNQLFRTVNNGLKFTSFNVVILPFYHKSTLRYKEKLFSAFEATSPTTGILVLLPLFAFQAKKRKASRGT